MYSTLLLTVIHMSSQNELAKIFSAVEDSGMVSPYTYTHVITLSLLVHITLSFLELHQLLLDALKEVNQMNPLAILTTQPLIYAKQRCYCM